MIRLTWTHQGMGTIGDADGPIDVLTAVYNGRIITRYQSRTHPTRGSHPSSYYVDGTYYRTQRAAMAAIDTREPTYRIEVLDEDGHWVPAPGEAGGWTREAATRAIAAGIPTMDGSPAEWADIRLVPETT